MFKALLVSALGASAICFALAACDDEIPATRISGDGATSDGLVTPNEAGVLPDGALVGDGGVPLDDSGFPVVPIDGGKAFDFAPPYVATLGPSSRSAGHNFAGNVPVTNPWRKRCLDCHKAGGTAASMPFFAAGSVHYKADGGPASSAEVRLKRYLNANAVSAYTDSDGNWYVTTQEAQDADVNFVLRPGIRNATLVQMMGPSPGIGSCNQCHNGSNYL